MSSCLRVLDTSAGTGKLCILGHLGLVFIWSCFVSYLLFLLFYVSLRNLCSGTCRKIQDVAHFKVRYFLWPSNTQKKCRGIYEWKPSTF